MRKLLYELSLTSGYNLSSSYGKADNCEIPNSCVRGDKLFLTFGHAIDVDTVIRSQSDVLISMFREPMSWLHSRWKHAYKFNNQKNSLLQGAKEYGSKYFNFADTETRQALENIFKKLADGHTIQEIPGRDIYSAMQGVRRLFQENCVVLIYDQLLKSVEHMALVLENKKLHQLFTGKYRFMPINKGPNDRYIDKAVREISEETRNSVTEIMTLHFMIYREALTEFSRQLFTPLRTP